MTDDQAILDRDAGARLHLAQDVGHGATGLEGKFSPRPRLLKRDQDVVAGLNSGVVLRGDDGAGADLRPLEVHQHRAAPADLLSGCLDMGDHSCPGGGTVVGTVDARDIHASGYQLSRHVRVFRRLGRHGHHDAGLAALVVVVEQLVGVALQAHAAAEELVRRRPLDGGGIGTAQHLEVGDHRIERRQDARFAAAEAGQAPMHQLLL